MDIANTIQELSGLSIDDRMRVIEAVWDSIADDADQLALTDAQRNELARRMAAHEANPHDVVSWESVRAAALARVAK